jgi:hypothetical protein
MSSQPEPVREPVMNTKTYYTTPPVIDVSTSGPTIEIPENRILGNTNLPDEAQPGLEGTSRRPAWQGGCLGGTFRSRRWSALGWDSEVPGCLTPSSVYPHHRPSGALPSF